MTDGNENGAEETEAEPPAVTLESRLEDAAAALEDAETEDDLDEVADTLAAIEADVEAADFPEPAEDDEEAEDPRGELEAELDRLESDLEERRGPYVEDVAALVREAAGTLEEGTWTKAGAAAARDAVAEFLATVDEAVPVDPLPGDVVVADDGDEPTYGLPAAVDALEAAADEIEGTALDPDADAETIADLLAAAESLQADLEAAEEWSDLSMREQLDALGFYDVLTPENRVDFPPEWAAMKSHATAGNVEMLLAALEKMGDADFMEEYVFEQLVHLGRDAAPAFEEMHRRAQKRNKPPIEILGKIADDGACETLQEFIEDDGDPGLQTVTLRALGEIGSPASTQAVANRLDAEAPVVRSAAARALGLIGDTRAIAPLSDVLDSEDETDEVRASAAWALRQIGTERALDALAPFADDRSYIVQAEAQKAAGT
jgi:ElaB/YqjD/DUF883 family membrane-anchored ribosome-binding protein